MIFKQIDEILSGQKTQTRRVVKPGEFVYQHGNQNPDGPSAILSVSTLVDSPEKHAFTERIKWAVGRTYAVVPKRGKPGVWWKVSDGIPYAKSPIDWSIKAGFEDFYPVNILNGMIHDGWQPLRIRITAIRRERLQDISEADAKAEGVGNVEEYRALWDSINTRKGTRWQDCPDVWVITFEVVR